MDHFESYKLIQGRIQTADGDSDAFAKSLRNDRIEHLSFSQISTVEFCHYRYYLQYIRLMEPDPVPDYFVKGKLFHQAVAAHYRESLLDGERASRQASEMFEREFEGESQQHLKNAFQVHLEHYWQDCEIVGVEKPFVMLIEPDLPPLVGVIDLILKQDGAYILVDHKTGSEFYDDDRLQMAIYMEYIRREYGEEQCEFYYDHYRWVKMLGRIRKPAFHRTRVISSRHDWADALTRIRAGYEEITTIQHNQKILKNGACYRCPYRRNCYSYR